MWINIQTNTKNDQIWLQNFVMPDFYRNFSSKFALKFHPLCGCYSIQHIVGIPTLRLHAFTMYIRPDNTKKKVISLHLAIETCTKKITTIAER